MHDPTSEFPIRWKIARFLNRSRFLCWASLALFGLGYRTWPWEWIGFDCRKERKTLGCCWCGKFCNPARIRELYPDGHDTPETGQNA